MKIEFECDSFENLTFIVQGHEFKYASCHVMAERDSKALPVVDLVLKSLEGKFAEVIVRSHDTQMGKENFRRGFYVAELVSAEYAEESAFLTNVSC